MPALEYSEWIDTITLILTVSGLILGFIYSQVLQHADDRTDLIASLRDGKVRRLYQDGVNWLLRGLQKLYGNKNSLQAFNLSFLLSILYPLLLFVLSYSYFNGTNVFSGSLLLPVDSLYQPYFFPLFLFYAISMFAALNFSTQNVVYLSICIVIAVTSNIIAIAFGANSIAIIFAAISSTVFAIAVFLIMPVFVSTAIAIGTVVTAFGSVAGMISQIFYENYNISLMFAFFYLILPLVNALLDWLSWWVSRFFLERTAQESRVRVIVLDVVLDFGVAVLFMLALCLLLPAGAMVLDSLYAGWVDVKSGVPTQTGWQGYAVWARDDPWGKGIMVTLMLVTTLIPTLLHILLGLMAFFIHGFKGAALADFLEQPRRNWRDGIASLWMFGYVVLAVAALLAMYQVFQYFAQWPIAQWLYDFTGYFYDLP